MACNPLNGGITIECPRDSRGGLRFVRLANFADIESYEETAGAISKIIMKPGKAFFSFNFPRNTSSFTITPTSNDQAGSFFYDESLNIVINKMSKATSVIFDALCRGLLVAIAEDVNGNSFLFGRKEGITLRSGAATSGVSYGDRNGFDITFKGEEKAISPMAEAYIIQQQGACYFVDRSGNRFVDRTGGGIYIPCIEPDATEFEVLIDFFEPEFF